VVLATQVLRLQTPAILAAVTIVAALLFNLPRRYLQRAIARRYHRPA
jgi:hypothetical protein